jgi:adenylate kinase family enzyme
MSLLTDRVLNLSRVNVVGTSGSGKTTFARRLASALDAPFIELDRLYWGPNWKPIAEDIFRERLSQAVAVDRWVLDGNYISRSEDIKWKNVTTVIWLDYSFPRTLKQSIGRAFYRALSKQEIWPGTGNRESFRKLLFSCDSMVLWTLSNYFPTRRRYLKKMQSPQFEHIHFLRLACPADADRLIQKIKSDSLKPDSSNAAQADNRQQ